MAVYKIPQDVEAEDKLIGPFTFRQFIFLIVAFVLFWSMILLFRINPVLIVIPLPFFIVFAVLGIYRRPDQPVEIYLVALLRFYFKPHHRIWNQEGIIETVRITAPKKEVIDPNMNTLSKAEARNRLHQLADIMDTRGWSTKNVAVQEGAPIGIADSDRLVVPTWTAEPVDVHESDDMLYPYAPTVQNFSAMTDQATAQIRQQALQQMQAHGATPQVAPAPAAAPNYNPYGTMHQRVIQPPAATPANASTSAMTATPDPDILRLSQNNDLSVSTIARQANQMTDGQQPPSPAPGQ